MTPPRRTRAIATGLLLVAFAAFWRLAGPTQLGGGAAYVITHGTSMQPEYHEGDLVVLRKADAYTEGDIVGYESPSLGRTVLHRIHRTEGGAFITKGDNNSWLDTDRLQSADVIGKAWLHLPGAGEWLAKTRNPVVVTVLIGLVGLSFLLSSQKKEQGRRARTGKGPALSRIAFGSFTQDQKLWLRIVGGATLAMFLLGVFTFRQPLVSAITADAAYEHVGAFGYSADVTESPVYPTGKVEPGRPVFLKLVDQLKVTFDYTLNTQTTHSVSGEALMFARVTGATGWKKVIPIARVTPFKGNKVQLAGTLDFDTIKDLSREVQSITGLPESAQNVELVARVDVTGDVAGAQITEQFAPALPFQMDTLQLQLIDPEGGPLSGESSLASFRHSQPGAVSVDETKANQLQVLGLSVQIRTARQASILGLLFGLIALGVLWRRFSNPALADEASVISAQYGDWLIPVEAMPQQAGHKAVQVKSMAALVRLAELYERMILHEDAPRGHTYFVEEEGVMYYYRPAPSSELPIEPSSSPRFGNRTSREERRRDEVERLRNELSQIEAEVLREKAQPSEE